MRCKKCGKIMRKDERFCEACGYYNGEKDNTGWDNEPSSTSFVSDDHEFDDYQDEQFELKDSSGTKSNEFYYENEDLLEAYIGEDYKSIKKIPFNFFAFLLNWSYCLYRKLYITGIVGLIVTTIIAIFFKEALLTYWIIVSVLLGILFNFYYVFIAKRKVELIKKKYEGTDKFGLMNICEEKGGVNLWLALGVYFVFILIIFFSYVNVFVNPSNNTKYWKENSENRATCLSLVHVGYNNLETYKVPGTVDGAVCKVSKKNFVEYDIYLKTIENGKTYYAYFYAEKDGVIYKRNTSEISELELKKANDQITEEEQTLLNSLKQIENNYSDISKQSAAEDELIKKKQNKSEKLNYLFSKEEVIR